ncbi:hypothetical protein R3P38DRAFT_3475165 [Favolaschia claudopus]|uniref:DUF4470 domain-containing protein n=1 Tax=Favolaschia claudopus TaxID=2862362 RepID=A0AAW0CFL0_9AGAR
MKYIQGQWGSAEEFPIASESPWGWALSRFPSTIQTESASVIHKLLPELQTTMAKKKKSPKTAPPTSVQEKVSTPESLKEEGNALFKSGKFHAALTDPPEPLKNILRSSTLMVHWIILTSSLQAADLAPSVATYHGNLSAALTEEGEYLKAIKAIQRAEEVVIARDSEESCKLLAKLSDRLARCLYGASRQNIIDSQFTADHAKLITDLRKLVPSPGKSSWWTRYHRLQFETLPIRRSTLYTGVEYFTIGHDSFHSLLQGCLSGWGPHSEATCPGDSDIPKHSAGGQSTFSFLFGGVGDARHVYSTLLDIYLQNRSSKQVTAHFSLVDIQPAALARDLIFLLVAWNASSTALRSDTKGLSSKTAFYLFCGGAMPPDSYDLLMKTCRELKTALGESPPRLPSFIIIEPGLIPLILESVSFWLDLPSAITTAKVLECMIKPDPKEFISGLRQPLIRAECEVFASLKVLIPPYMDEFEAASNQVEFGRRSDLKGVRRYIEKHWKPNPTLFDPRNYALYNGGHYPNYFDRFGSPNRLAIDASDTLYGRLIDHDPSLGSRGMDPRWPSFTKFHTALFGPMVSALELLKTQVKFEFIGGDVVNFMALLKSGSSFLDWRKDSPTSFTRAWMSNVPDYAGGLLDMALYAVPCLQSVDVASVGMNCLFNGPTWNNKFDDFVYTYTLLLPDQLPQYLGCKLRWFQRVPSILHQPFCLLPCKLPLNSSSHASRTNLEAWLHRVLLRILSPPALIMELNHYILLPTTFRTFMELLIRTVELGYPISWIAEFLNSILSDTLHSTWRPYASSPMPANTITVQYSSTKLQLSSWMADIEVVVASAVPNFPSDLGLSNYLNFAEIGVYRAKIQDIAPDPDHYIGLALLFCAPKFPVGRGSFATRDVLLAKTPSGHAVQIVYSILTREVDVDKKTGTVSWKMSNARFERMKREGWGLYFWLPDLSMIASARSDASDWERI